MTDDKGNPYVDLIFTDKSGKTTVVPGPMPTESTSQEDAIRLDERKQVLAVVFAIMDRRAQAYEEGHFGEAHQALDLAVREIVETLLPEGK